MFIDERMIKLAGIKVDREDSSINEEIYRGNADFPLDSYKEKIKELFKIDVRNILIDEIYYPKVYWVILQKPEVTNNATYTVVARVDKLDNTLRQLEKDFVREVKKDEELDALIRKSIGYSPTKSIEMGIIKFFKKVKTYEIDRKYVLIVFPDYKVMNRFDLLGG